MQKAMTVRVLGTLVAAVLAFVLLALSARQPALPGPEDWSPADMLQVEHSDLPRPLLHDVTWSGKPPTLDNGVIENNPLTGRVASVSVGIYQGTPVLDLDYPEDCNAETDMNVVMSDAGDFIEVQGTAEGHPFSLDELNAMLTLARKGINELLASQREVLAQA